jgi:hypothetical protein
MLKVSRIDLKDVPGMELKDQKRKKVAESSRARR